MDRMPLGFLTVFSLIFIFQASPGSAQAVHLEGTDQVFQMIGAATGDVLGRPVVCPDLDGDGFDEIVVGADRFSFGPGQRPTLYIVRGSADYRARGTIHLATQSADAVIYAEAASTNLGTSMAVGDVNGDGLEDLIITDSTLAANGRTRAGVAYVLFGNPLFFNQATYDFENGDWDLKILGAAAGDDLGGANLFGGLTSHGCAAGDITADGVADIALGAHLATANGRSEAGRIFIVFGDTGFTSGTTIDLASQADSIIEANEGMNELGTALVIGDISGDGIGDLVAGYEWASQSTFSSEGKVLGFFGRSNFPSSINLASQNPNLTIIGGTAGDMLGAVVALSDVNRDGILDLVAGASGWNSDAGAYYGFYGGSGLVGTFSLSGKPYDFMVQGMNVANDIGSRLATGDFNGDGGGDFLFATRDGERAGFNSEGRTFVVFGSSAGVDEILRVADEDADVIINGGLDYFQLGDWVASGDFDGDGAEEIVISAPFVDTSTGKLLVFDLTVPTSVDEGWADYR
jgi:hypothetical protein